MLALLLALVLSGQDAPAPKPKAVRLPETYAHPFYAFKIYLPPKWQRGEGKTKEKISFYGPKDGAFLPRIDMSIDTASGTLDDYLEKFTAAFEKGYPGTKVTRTGAVSGRAGEGRIFVAEFDHGGIPTVSIWTFFAPDKRRFALAFSVSKNWAERYLPAVEASMCSLRLYEQPKATPEQQQVFNQDWAAARTANLKGALDEAAKGFRRCIALVPEFAEVHSALGVVLMKQKNFTDAEAELKKAVEIDPEDPTFHYNLGSCLLRQEKYAAAIQALEKSADGDAESEPTLTNLGVAYLGAENPARASEVLLRAVKADPESATAHYNLAMAYEKLGKSKEAATEYGETLKLDKNHAGAKDGLKRVKK